MCGWIVGPERTLVRDGPQKKLTAMRGEFGSGTIQAGSVAVGPQDTRASTLNIPGIPASARLSAPAMSSGRALAA